MESVEESGKVAASLGSGLHGLSDHTGVSRPINPELWNACAGPLVTLPQVGSLVFYFPQGHSEQVAFSTKSATTSQIPNYPILPPQLMCQVHSVVLHADKETDEVYAQMSLQPVNSEKDVFPIPDFGLRPQRHPSAFFCKTLTASDTSTHGGFSVPRRAAEKLFPPLDYTMQPPTQELIVRDLHNNMWTFRHIYRGQPKRHLLTTGWSLFVGAKRLRASDSVLFIREQKSQLLVGVRRACRQQKMLPSSVLSADSMHIGVLAAAAHAAANRTVFTVFYNPRACPSEFVIPLSKYKKCVHGVQVSAGTRFGMMFETEESGKRRYTGTVVGISDLDPLKWPGSKWRNIQVEWDEPGSGGRQRRVSAWEIETPESHFIFPSITSGFKRPLHSTFWGQQSEWMNLIRRSLVQTPENDRVYHHLHGISAETPCRDQFSNMLQVPPPAFPPAKIQQRHRPVTAGSEDPPKPNKNPPCPFFGPVLDIQSVAATCESQNPGPLQVRTELDPPPVVFPGQVDPFSTDDRLLSSLAFPDTGFFHGAQGPWDHQMDGVGCSPLPSDRFDQFGLLDPGCFGPGLFPDDSNNQSGVYGCVNYETGGPSVSGTGFDDYGGSSAAKDSSFTDSLPYELPDSSGCTSTSNVDFDESTLLGGGPWRQVAPPPPMRTYTKVQKTGSVGRSVDVTTFTGYDELCSAIEHMFGLEGMLSDQRSSGWKLVYIDYESDVLLVGDDPWEEFVICVRCIRILSPAEVHQMSEEGMHLLSNGGVGCTV